MYDIDFIVNNFSDIVTPTFKTRLEEFVIDEDALYDKFEDAYNEDLLVNVKVELDDLIIRLSKNIKQL